jgi:hypothetical protein
LDSDDGKWVVQAKSDGLTVSRMQPYTSWEEGREPRCREGGDEEVGEDLPGCPATGRASLPVALYITAPSAQGTNSFCP